MKKQGQRLMPLGNILLSFIIISGMIIIPIPSVLAAVDDFQGRLAGGEHHTLAVHSDGTVMAWGDNAYGQLGDGSTQSRSTPVQVKDLTNVQSVATGRNHSLALKEDGTVWAWGVNDRGQLGDYSTTTRDTPVKTSFLYNIIAIAAAHDQSFALRNDGILYAWGDNSYVQLNVEWAQDKQFYPKNVYKLTNVQAFATGEQFALALTGDGTLWGWGENRNCELGQWALGRVVPLEIMTNVQAIAAGGKHAFAIDRDGNLWGWGSNEYGQLGNGLADNRYCAPVHITDKVQAVVAGYDHTLILKEDGTLWTSGRKIYGQLGDGDSGHEFSREFVQVQTDAKLKAIAAGYNHSLALTEDGAVLAWGNNGSGQLGDGYVGDIHNRNIPIPVYNLFSTDAYLQNVTLSEGTLTPRFSKYNFNYQSSVPYETEKITVTPTTGNAKSTVKVSINGGTETVVQSSEASPPLSLRVGSNKIHVDVLAENKSVHYSYAVNVIRQHSNVATADLSDIRLGSGAVLNEPFQASITDYTADVVHSIENVTVMPIALDPTSTITVSVNEGVAMPAKSGEASLPLALDVGTNTIVIDVKSRDGLQSKRYVLAITRNGGTESSNIPVINVRVGTSFTATIYDPTKSFVGEFVGLSSNGITGNLTGTGVNAQGEADANGSFTKLQGVLNGTGNGQLVEVKLSPTGPSIYVRFTALPESDGQFEVNKITP